MADPTPTRVCMPASMQWLAGRVALLAGDALCLDVVADTFRSHGANVVRVAIAADRPAAQAALAAATGASGQTPTVLVHAGAADGVLTGASDSVAAVQEPGLARWRASLIAGLDSRFFYAAEFAVQCMAARQRGAMLWLDVPALSYGVIEAATVGASCNLVQTLSVEWARDGLRANAIVSRRVADADAAQLRSLGQLAAYLCSDYAAYIAGCSVGIDDLA